MSLALNGAFFANGAVLICAVGFSACAKPEERKAAVICTAALTASWMVSCASYTDYSLSGLLANAGVNVTYLDIWSVLNALIGILALCIARGVWWGWALWGLLWLACINDLSLWVRASDLNNVPAKQWAPFGAMADLLFWGEAAIFYVIGGKIAASLVIGRIRRWGVLPVRNHARVTKALSRRGQ